MRTAFTSLAVAAAILSASAPAFAKAANTTSEAADQVVLTPNADGSKLCTARTMITGSILPQQVCKTRAEWMNAGAHSTKRS